MAKKDELAKDSLQVILAGWDQRPERSGFFRTYSSFASRRQELYRVAPRCSARSIRSAKASIPLETGVHREFQV